MQWPQAELSGTHPGTYAERYPPVNSKHYASITEAKAVGALLRAIDGYEGHFVTRCALRLAPLVFVRPGERRNGRNSTSTTGNGVYPPRV
jgi:hypothetical protein